MADVAWAPGLSMRWSITTLAKESIVPPHRLAPAGGLAIGECTPMTDADATVPTDTTQVIYESPTLELSVRDDEAQRGAEVFAQTDRAEVAVVDGFGNVVVG